MSETTLRPHQPRGRREVLGAFGKSLPELAASAVGLGGWVCDFAADSFIADECLRAMFGWEPGSVPGTCEAFLSCVHPDDRQRVEEAFKRVLGKDGRFEILCRVVHSDGKVKHIRTFGAAVQTADSTVRKVAGVCLEAGSSTGQTERLSGDLGRLQRAVLGSADASWDWDLVTGRVALSEQFAELLGYSDDELPHALEGFRSLVHPEDAKRAFDTIWQHIEDDRPYDIEFRLRTKTDGYRWFRGRGCAIRDESEPRSRTCGSIEDIHDRRLAAKELERATQYLRLALQAGRIGVWSWDIGTGVVTWDDRMHLLFGVAPGTFRQTFDHFAACLHPEDLDRVSSAVRTALEDDTEYDIVFRVIWPDESIRHIAARGAVLRDHEGKPTQMTGVCMDVTRAKNMELQLQQSEARYRDLFDNAPDMMAVISMETGEVLECNQALLDTTGRQKEQTLGTHFLDLYPPDLEKVANKAFEEFKTGQIVEAERTFCRPDGTRIPVLLRSTPIRDLSGKIVASRSTWRDITERKRVERLEQSNAELEQFAYVASHDLQEPLRKIEAFSGRLRAKCGPALSGQGQEYLESILRGVSRMRALIDDLLTLSRVRTRANQFEKIELADVVEDVLSDLAVRIEESSARVEVGPLPVIHADPTQMRQLMQNLIANALKFRRLDAQPVVSVRCSNPEQNNADHGRNRPATCEILVEDNGIGFEPRYNEKIFAVFERLHSRGQYEGTGVGLAVCQRIVERHGGTIRAEGRPGQGATFVVTLLTQPVEEG